MPKSEASLQIEIEGLTGNISFSHEGKRKDYNLDVVEMSANSQPVKVGTAAIILATRTITI